MSKGPQLKAEEEQQQRDALLARALACGGTFNVLKTMPNKALQTFIQGQEGWPRAAPSCPPPPPQEQKPSPTELELVGSVEKQVNITLLFRNLGYEKDTFDHLTPCQIKTFCCALEKKGVRQAIRNLCQDMGCDSPDFLCCTSDQLKKAVFTFLGIGEGFVANLTPGEQTQFSVTVLRKGTYQAVKYYLDCHRMDSAILNDKKFADLSGRIFRGEYTSLQPELCVRVICDFLVSLGYPDIQSTSIHDSRISDFMYVCTCRGALAAAKELMSDILKMDMGLHVRYSRAIRESVFSLFKHTTLWMNDLLEKIDSEEKDRFIKLSFEKGVQSAVADWAGRLGFDEARIMRLDVKHCFCFLKDLSERGHLETLENWASKKLSCDIDFRDERGDTTLKRAVSQKNTGLARYLMMQGAEPFLVSTSFPKEKNPMLFIYQITAQISADWSQVCYAAGQGNIQRVQPYLEKGWGVSFLLLFAAQCEDLNRRDEMVAFLLRQPGADPTQALRQLREIDKPRQSKAYEYLSSIVRSEERSSLHSNKVTP